MSLSFPTSEMYSVYEHWATPSNLITFLRENPGPGNNVISIELS